MHHVHGEDGISETRLSDELAGLIAHGESNCHVGACRSKACFVGMFERRKFLSRQGRASGCEEGWSTSFGLGVAPILSQGSRKAARHSSQIR